ncbi:MAG: FAD:protein FMN transferase [Candidatus Wallbacteria bacterium]|nr:FAD:protein FMN transferase [Candidatus Wallbacteria bacterium]
MDLGGNLFVGLPPASQDSWRIGVKDPIDSTKLMGVLRLREEAVATSGGYERFVEIGGRRYGHVLDPRTGRPAEGLLSATVVAPTATAADALSTVCYVLGPDGSRSLLAREHAGSVKTASIESQFVASAA